MKVFLRTDLVLHLLMVLLFGILYPFLVWGMGRFLPRQASGLPILENNRCIGFENIGQNFTLDTYFQGRPSAVDYNASATGGSNKGPNNPEYLAVVEQRIKDFLQKNPTVLRSEIPSDLVTASGSGIDTHISLKATKIQIERIARCRGMDAKKLEALVDSMKETPWLGIFGIERINVLRLNLALDKWKLSSSD
ncbi:MAG: potassium-transporting ATPase subunit KdpC [Planctomycetota bacterium]